MKWSWYFLSFWLFTNCVNAAKMTDWLPGSPSVTSHHTPLDVQKVLAEVLPGYKKLPGEDVMFNMVSTQSSLFNRNNLDSNRAAAWMKVQSKLKGQVRNAEYSTNFTTPSQHESAVCTLVIAGRPHEKRYFAFCSTYENLQIPNNVPMSARKVSNTTGIVEGEDVPNDRYGSVTSIRSTVFLATHVVWRNFSCSNRWYSLCHQFVSCIIPELSLTLAKFLTEKFSYFEQCCMEQCRGTNVCKSGTECYSI